MSDTIAEVADKAYRADLVIVEAIEELEQRIQALEERYAN